MKYLVAILLFLISGTTIVNGQQTWQEHESPVNSNLHKVFFASETVGWIITHDTGEILHTKDGGQNWKIQTEVADSLFLESIYFLDKNTGWISGQNGLLFSTDDGGENWVKEKIADKKSWIYSIHFFDEQEGIAIGVRESKPRKLFLYTENGGKKWKKPNDIPESYYTSINFIDDEVGYAAGMRYILNTQDGGVTWQTQFPDTSKNSNSNPVIRDILFVTPENGWAIGHQGVILKTTNGKDWEAQKPFTNNLLRSIAFIDDSEGFIVGDSNNEPGVLFHTTDGGKSWETYFKNKPNLHDITITKNKIWLVGENGTILSKSR